MKLLITGAKSAKAFTIAAAYPDDQIFMADYDEVPQVPFKNYTFLSLGAQNPDTTAHTLLSFCLDNALDAILPVYDFEIDALSKSLVLFNEFDIQIILPNAV